MDNLSFLIEQIAFARKYTLRILDTIEQNDWFRQPSERITHVAWQVGHLAVSEYWLALVRVRGPRPDDTHLVPEPYIALFGRNTVPGPDASTYPPPEEIRQVLDRVHEQALKELSALPPEELDKSVGKPHPLFTTKQGALVWCAQHELVHAGQIGLLRRLFGQRPIW